MDTKQLVQWFEKNKRDLPWRKATTPYRVWVSEVMLQQTTAKAVIPYFEKWMKTFPDLESLAKATIEEVIKLWEGLGYYSRARRLHSGAQKIMKKYQGVIPSSYEELKTIEGLGPYTIGAILSFAFKQKALAIDGNVIRVVSRLLRLNLDVSKAQAKKEMNNYLEKKLPNEKPFVVMEALIELGALICLKKPNCGKCPLRLDCQAFEKKDPEKFPVKPQRKAQQLLIRDVVIVSHEGALLLKKETDSSKIMADLYEFPYFEAKHALLKFLKSFEKSIRMIKKHHTVTHYFTKYKANLFPIEYRALEKIDMQGYEWVEKHKLAHLPFSSGHKKILNALE